MFCYHKKSCSADVLDVDNETYYFVVETTGENYAEMVGVMKNAKNHYFYFCFDFAVENHVLSDTEDMFFTMVDNEDNGYSVGMFDSLDELEQALVNDKCFDYHIDSELFDYVRENL